MRIRPKRRLPVIRPPPAGDDQTARARAAEQFRNDRHPPFIDQPTHEPLPRVQTLGDLSHRQLNLSLGETPPKSVTRER